MYVPLDLLVIVGKHVFTTSIVTSTFPWSVGAWALLFLSGLLGLSPEETATVTVKPVIRPRDRLSHAGSNQSIWRFP